MLEEDDWASATTGNWLAHVAPEILDDRDAVRWYTSYVQRGASPGANRAIRLMNAEIDVRDVLPTISVPTLVLYRADETFRERSRYMGERIPGARMVELPGNDHLPWEGDRESLLDEIERFLSGLERRRRARPGARDPTVHGHRGRRGRRRRPGLERAARTAHRVVRAQLRASAATRSATAASGLVATFDGPARAVRCASAIVASVRELGLEVRAGVHTGEIERSNGEVARHRGATSARASRPSAGPGEVLVSGTVKDIVAGSGLGFDERGEHELAGVPGTWRLFAAGG